MIQRKRTVYSPIIVEHGTNYGLLDSWGETARREARMDPWYAKDLITSRAAKAVKFYRRGNRG